METSPKFASYCVCVNFLSQVPLEAQTPFTLG